MKRRVPLFIAFCVLATVTTVSSTNLASAQEVEVGNTPATAQNVCTTDLVQEIPGEDQVWGIVAVPAQTTVRFDLADHKDAATNGNWAVVFKAYVREGDGSVGAQVARKDWAAPYYWSAIEYVQRTVTITNSTSDSRDYYLHLDLSVVVAISPDEGARIEAQGFESSSGGGAFSEFQCGITDAGTCAESGDNFWFSEPVTLGGETYAPGCYTFDSCVSELPLYIDRLAEWSCENQDLLHDLLVIGVAFVLVLGAVVVVVGAASAGAVAVGAEIGSATIATSLDGLLIGGAAYLFYLATTSPQFQEAPELVPTLVQDIVDSLPQLPDQNRKTEKGLSESAFQNFLKLGVQTCLAEISIETAIANAGVLGIPAEAIDAASGLVDLPDETVHLCQILNVYVAGGTSNNLKTDISQASLHIRDVLTGESSGEGEDMLSNPPTPQPAWSFLTYEKGIQHPGKRDWYTRSAYGCKVKGGSGNHCDEFPFYSTTQGGPGSHLRIIPGGDNSGGGNDYQRFLGACSVDSGQSFMVVPMPADAISLGTPSLFLCD